MGSSLGWKAGVSPGNGEDGRKLIDENDGPSRDAREIASVGLCGTRPDASSASAGAS